MKLVDTNVLVYAVNSAAQRHDDARTWLDAQLSGAGTVGFSWVALLAFVRLSTSGCSRRPSPSPRRWCRPGRPRRPASSSSPRRPTYALAIQHRGTVITYDNDGRFRGVRWSTPSSV